MFEHLSWAELSTKSLMGTNPRIMYELWNIDPILEYCYWWMGSWLLGKVKSSSLLCIGSILYFMHIWQDGLHENIFFFMFLYIILHFLTYWYGFYSLLAKCCCLFSIKKINNWLLFILCIIQLIDWYLVSLI
jgi:hypothetical protein